jgi:hypothetical protein
MLPCLKIYSMDNIPVALPAPPETELLTTRYLLLTMFTPPRKFCKSISCNILSTTAACFQDARSIYISHKLIRYVTLSENT